MAAGTGQTTNNTAEGGTSGTTVTTANSGAASGNAWQTVTIGTGSALTFDNTHATRGGLGYKISNGTSAKSLVQWTTTFGTQTTFYGRFYAYLASNTAIIAPFQAATGGTQRCAIGFNSTGVIQIYGTGAALVNGTVAMATNAWVRIEFTFTLDTVTGSGTAKLFNNPESLIPSDTISISGQNLGATTATQWSFGIANSPVALQTVWMDSIALSTDGYLGVDNSEMRLNNFQGVKAEDNGNGVMSVGERIR